MAWYYANQGQQAGPVDDAAFDGLVRQGVVRDDTLVWKEGMAAWQPYSAVRPSSLAAAPTVVMQIPPGGFGGATSSPAPAAQSSPSPVAQSPMSSAPAAPAANAGNETRFCSQCGRPTPVSQLRTINGAPTCNSCASVGQPVAAAPVQQPGMQQPGMQQPGQQPWGQMQMPAGMGGMGMAPGMQAPGAYHYGGFWIRFLAFVIDAIILGIVGLIITLPLTLLGLGTSITRINGDDPTAALAALPAIFAAAGLSTLIRLALNVGYEAYFLPKNGATLGKMALGLKVIRVDGGRIGVGLAIGRFFARILSGIILCIGFIMAGFDPQKRALHDRICGTYVIYSK
jgi:uncharacterized RDD family membrane protein YckC